MTKSNTHNSTKFYSAFVFSTGAAVMLLEFAASRLMAPWFGTSIFVWGNIIGVVLIALSLGYYIGGRLADRNPQPERLFDIVWLAGVICSIIPIFAYIITFQIGAAEVSSVSAVVQTIVGSFMVVLILFAIPIMLLGMVSPFVIRLATTTVEEAGKVAGSLYAASTVGSIIGTFASSFLVVPLLGSRETILISSTILIVVSAAGSKVRWKRLTVLVVPLVVYGLFATSLLQVNAGVLHEEETLYQFVQVKDAEDRLLLSYNEGLGTQSYFMKEGVLTGGYFDYVTLIPPMANFPDDAEVGVLGLAGGTATRLLRHYYPEYTLMGVEIDPAIPAIANEYFELDKQDVEVVIADARMYMRNTDKQFHMVLIDAFSNEIYIPWHMTTREFFTDIKGNLHPGGVVALNIGSTHRNTALLESMLFTLQDSFQHVYIYPVPGTFNNLVYASDTPVNKNALHTITGELEPLADSMYRSVRESDIQNGTVLTDNRSPIELYTEAMIAQYIIDRI